MKKLFLILLLSSLLGANGLNRFALIVGANDGGKNRDLLRYAQTDGQMFTKVLSEMGGLNSANLITLNNPSPADVLLKLKEISLDMKKKDKGVRSEFVFYYSGHADEYGLLLGEKSLDYQTLKSEIDKIDSEIKIAILDACASGAITRIKGGVRKEAFLSGDKIDLKGYAILTSSSETEASQESDQIGGSFFTHYLVSGLRGAADKSGDGKVTLNEAYDYAYNETLLRTSRSKGGVQHPNYDMKLSGSGEIIMTDLRKVDATLIIPALINGRFFLKNEKGQLVAEIAKSNTQIYNMGLAEGNYELVRLESGVLSHMRFDLSRGDKFELNENQLLRFSPEHTASRGSSTDDYIRDYQADAAEEEVKVLGISDFLFNKNTVPTVGAQFSLLANYAHRRHRGIQGALFTNIAMEEVNTQLTTGVNVAMGNLDGFQIAAVANLNGSLWNDSPKNKQYVKLDGAQIGSGFNYAEHLEGFQISGGGNAAYLLDGFQISGAFNVAEELKGFQISAGLNIVEKIEGVQIGTINAADSVDGFQLGIFNYANHIDGVALGLFNYAGNGVLGARYSADETGLNKISLFSGAASLYVEYILGTHLYDTKQVAMGLGLGSRVASFDYFNVHVGVEALSVFENIELHEESTWNNTQELINAKVQLGYKPFKDYFEMFLGVKYSIADIRDQGVLLEKPSWSKTYGDSKVQHWPGLYMGVSLGKL